MIFFTVGSPQIVTTPKKGVNKRKESYTFKNLHNEKRNQHRFKNFFNKVSR